jgi:uncharacterized protein YkwD
MRWSPRFAASLAVGSALLTIAAFAAPSQAHRAPVSRVLAQEPAQASPAPQSSSLLAVQYKHGIDAAVPVARETPDEARFVDLVNMERSRRGLNILKIDPLLIAIARTHSQEMCDKAYFSHDSPTAELKTPRDRYLLALSEQPDYACVGENLFYCSIADVQRGHNAFMNSPAHRDNVLFPHFDRIGIGIVKNRQGEFWVTQMYLTNTDYKIAARKLESARK